MSTLPISEAIIRHNSNASSCSRGEEYYQRGAVYDVKKRGNSLQASVEGSEIRPYQVSVNFDAGGVTFVRCSCPYDYDCIYRGIAPTILLPGRVILRSG
ncbi:MAG: hypothetical protein QNJ47_05440 [Nostocaceae cyanobacterium]|nr:hypothetical protein [Nostocaceae cyanobacterium]